MKLCPFLNQPCVKADCMAWVKIEDTDSKDVPLGTFKNSYCGLLRQQ